MPCRQCRMGARWRSKLKLPPVIIAIGLSYPFEIRVWGFPNSSKHAFLNLSIRRKATKAARDWASQLPMELSQITAGKLMLKASQALDQNSKYGCRYD